MRRRGGVGPCSLVVEGDWIGVEGEGSVKKMEEPPFERRARELKHAWAPGLELREEER